MLTVDEVQTALPANLKSAATPALVNKINAIASDPLVAEQIRDNFIGYTHVLREGKYKTEDYLHAVTYVSYKLMGMSNLDAYSKTFPKRYQNLVSQGRSSKDIAAYVAAYNKGKLVNAVFEQSLVPTHVLNADIYQKAINTQANLMLTAKSEKVQSDAANSLLTHLAKPKEAGPGLQIQVQQDTGLSELKNMLEELAYKQTEAMKSGVSTEEIASQKLIEGKVK